MESQRRSSTLSEAALVKKDKHATLERKMTVVLSKVEPIPRAVRRVWMTTMCIQAWRSNWYLHGELAENEISCDGG